MANPLDLKRRRYIALHSDGLSKTLCHPFRAFKKKEKKKDDSQFQRRLKTFDLHLTNASDTLFSRNHILVRALIAMCQL